MRLTAGGVHFPFAEEVYAMIHIISSTYFAFINMPSA